LPQHNIIISISYCTDPSQAIQKTGISNYSANYNQRVHCIRKLLGRVLRFVISPHFENITNKAYSQRWHNAYDKSGGYIALTRKIKDQEKI